MAGEPRYGVLLDGPLLRWQRDCLSRLAEAAARAPAATVMRPTACRLGMANATGVLGRRVVPRLNGAEALANDVDGVLSEPEPFFLPDLDFVLSFADGPMDIPDGVEMWSFEIDDVFLAVASGEPTVTAALVRTRSGGIRETLREGRFRLHRHAPNATIDEVFYCLARWPALAIRQTCAPAGPPGRAPKAAQPIGDCEFFRWVIAQVAGLAVRGWSSVAEHQDWRIGMVDGSAGWALGANQPTVRWLPSPGRGEFLADPFLVHWQGRTMIFAEHYAHGGRLGRIVAIDPDAPADFAFCDLGVPAGTHMSYPYPVLDEAGALFCVPETHELREVALYAPIEFPLRWRKQQVLIERVAALDPTPFRHGGSWWMFFADADEGDGDRDLHLWYADRLTGPWKPHRVNPVKTDVGSARPAGAPFVHGGELFRPAQDCSRRYGGRVVIHRVTTLDPSAYAEEAVAVVEPIAPRSDGLHTLSSHGELSVIDGNRMRWVPTAAIGAVKRALRRVRS